MGARQSRPRPRSRARSRCGKSRSMGSCSRSPSGAGAGSSRRCCCSTGSAPTGSWRSRSLRRSRARRRSSLTCLASRGARGALLPYRPPTRARVAAGLVAELGYAEIDVAGVSWGGAIAQQFAHQYPKLCRRLVLAATAAGVTMVPASPSVLWKMATPRRYTDKDYMNRIAAALYGGAFRNDPSLIGRHASAMHGARNMGYLYQLLAVAGWTSLPWLWSLPQPTLVLMGSDDPLVPPINGHILAGLIPNAKLRLIDDGLCSLGR